MLMNVYGCQLDIVWENKPANHAKVRELLDAAAPGRGSLVVLPEMFSTGFSMNVPAVSDSPARETLEFLARTAADYGIYLAGGVVTAGAGGKGRNECAVFSPAGEEVARYCKLHPFTLGREAEHYEPGAGTRVFAWQGFTVAPFICYDLRFPEIFRAAARRGADLLLVIANWPTPRIHHWTTLLKARAIENQAYVVGVNRCGRDPQLDYAGRSAIIDEHGRALIEAGDQECVIKADLDRQALADYRRELPFLKDLRDDYLRPDGQ